MVLTLLVVYFSSDITKTCLYNIDPLKPHFYTVKLGFTGIYIIFLISAQKHRLWILIRLYKRGIRGVKIGKFIVIPVNGLKEMLSLLISARVGGSFIVRMR